MTTCIGARTKVICTIDFITESEPNKGGQRRFLPHPESPEFYSLNDEDTEMETSINWKGECH